MQMHNTKENTLFKLTLKVHLNTTYFAENNKKNNKKVNVHA